MNILYVTGMFAQNERDDALGGMAKAVYIHAKGMKDRGHDVRVLTVSNIKRRWKYRGIEVIAIKAEHGLDNISDLKMIYQIIRREILIQKEIQILSKERSIDIIQYTGWFGIGLLHQKSIPAVMRVSSYTKAQLSGNYSKRRVDQLSFIERIAMKRMNVVFAPSKVMAKKVEADIHRKVYVFETPYIQEHVHIGDNRLKKTIGEKKYILFFGRISVDKGINTIKDVLYKILNEYEGFYFVFVGTVDCNTIKKDDLFKSAKEYKDRLIFCGNLSKKELWPIIMSAQMILMPSLFDNFPNACAEAMSLGKIVIGTDGSSLEQFITNGYNGYLSEIGNAESLYEKIQVVMKLSLEEKKQISERARNRIQELNLESYCQKLDKLYQKIIYMIKEK